jgi:hypothetical protein
MPGARPGAGSSLSLRRKGWIEKSRIARITSLWNDDPSALYSEEYPLRKRTQ